MRFFDAFNRLTVVVDISARAHGTLQIADVGQFPVNFIFSLQVKHNSTILVLKMVNLYYMLNEAPCKSLLTLTPPTLAYGITGGKKHKADAKRILDVNRGQLSIQNCCHCLERICLGQKGFSLEDPMETCIIWRVTSTGFDRTKG